MRFATWNVNSLKVRLPRVEEFLGYADVDVLCLQETKLTDDKFPLAEINAASIGISTVIIPIVQRLSQGPARVLAEA